MCNHHIVFLHAVQCKRQNVNSPTSCFCSQLLELLHAMCRVSELKRVILSLMFQPVSPVTNERQGVEPVGCVLLCMGVVCSDGQEDVCVKSIELLGLLYEVDNLL